MNKHLARQIKKLLKENGINASVRTIGGCHTWGVSVEVKSGCEKTAQALTKPFEKDVDYILFA